MPKIKVINTETDETIDMKAGYGANLRKAALYNDAEVYKGLSKFLNCRGHGMCGKCVVEITSTPAPSLKMSTNSNPTRNSVAALKSTAISPSKSPS